MAAYCNEHTAAEYSEKCCHADHVLHINVSGETVWLNMPVKKAPAYIEHYLSCKAQAPLSTSSCILVPAIVKRASSRNRRLLKGMELVMQVSEGDDFWSASLPPGCWHIYADLKTPVLRMATSHEMIMCIAGRVAGARACVFFDSGASHVFMTQSFAERSGLRMRALSRATKVQLADGKELDSIGTCFTKIQLDTYSAGLSYYVTDITHHWDIVVGQSWMVAHDAVLDFGMRCVTGWKNAKRFSLFCNDSSAIESDAAPHKMQK